MKTPSHYLDFKTNDGEVVRWKGTESQYNYLMQKIMKFAQVIDLRSSLGKTFNFKQFTGEGGKLKDSSIHVQTLSKRATETPEEIKKRKESLRRHRKKWKDKGYSWAQ